MTTTTTDLSAPTAVTANGPETPVHVLTIETPSLGDRSYVVHDGVDAIVVDPQRDLDRIHEAIAAAGVTVRAVFETHVHNDYVSGGLALARSAGATYHLAADEHVAFAHAPTRDGDVVQVGSLEVRAVHTPGHTPTHLSYVVSTGGVDRLVLTGGGLLYGSVGRTDLIGEEHTASLSRAQHRSAHRLAEELADDVAVLPTHGFGSFCSSGETTGASASTIGDERRVNQALLIEDEDEFVEALLAGLDAWPAYYVHMAPANRAGPAAADLTPPTLADRTELARRIHAGEWVVDLRDRRAFAAGHLVGTINVELGDSTSTYLGWLLPWGTPVTLIGATAQDVAEAQRQLARIGIDRPAAQARSGDVLGDDAASYRVTDFAGLAAAVADGTAGPVVDLRRELERAASHVAGSIGIPLHELLDRMHELPDGELWVHCASGYRASIGASLLRRAGRSVVLVDDDAGNARAAGLPMVEG